MGGVSVSPALPIAVARAGAHAMYPGLIHTAETLAPILDALEPPFGVNFIVPMMDRGALELACERAPYVDFFLAEPDATLVALVGGVCGWQVETAEEARAAEAAGCDVVIVKGLESGGRKRVEGPELLPLLEAALNAVPIPVIAAGGIATAAARGGGARRRRRRCAASGRGSSRPTESDAHPAWIAAVIEATRRRLGRQPRVQRRYAGAGPAPRAAQLDRRRRARSPTNSHGAIGGVQLPPFAPSPPSRYRDR